MWPVAWGPDDHLYAAWGDGGGFGGSDSDGRVALGFARIEGGPEHWRGINVNGGKTAEYPGSFSRKGKTTGIAFVDGILYATVNLEDGTWPDDLAAAAAMADGAMADGVTADGPAPDGQVPDAGTLDGEALDGGTLNGASRSGVWADAVGPDAVGPDPAGSDPAE